jgi:hypothetical protein
MSKKKTTQVIVKTYGTSWISTIILALIVGAVGYLIAPTMQGFVVGFVMTFLCELFLLASFIPYVGIYLQWIWTIQLSQWLISLGNFTATQSAMFTNVLLYFPLILFTIFGVIVYLVITGVVTVFIGALIGAILSR